MKVPVVMRSKLAGTPMSLGRRWVPPAPGSRPKATSGNPSLAWIKLFMKYNVLVSLVSQCRHLTKAGFSSYSFKCIKLKTNFFHPANCFINNNMQICPCILWWDLQKGDTEQDCMVQKCGSSCFFFFSSINTAF